VHITSDKGKSSHEFWEESADVTTNVKPDMPPDEAGLQLVTDVLQVLLDRPAKAEEWLKERNDKLRERGIDPESYDMADDESDTAGEPEAKKGKGFGKSK